MRFAAVVTVSLLSSCAVPASDDSRSVARYRDAGVNASGARTLLFENIQSELDATQRGIFAFKSGNYQIARASFRMAADAGDPAAQTMLALMYSNGYGVEVSKPNAAYWYRRAADQGHGIALTNLGFMQYHGDGIPLEREEALRLFRKASLGGEGKAQVFLGGVLVQEGFEEQNQEKVDEGIFWLAQADDAGVEDADLILTLALQTIHDSLVQWCVGAIGGIGACVCIDEEFPGGLFELSRKIRSLPRRSQKEEFLISNQDTLQKCIIENLD